MIAIQDFFDQLFSGVEITPEEKSSLLGLYTLLYYKSLLETLSTLKSQDKSFFDQLNTFFDNHIQTLPADDQKILTEVMQKQQSEIVTTLAMKLGYNLSTEPREKLEQNLVNLSASTSSDNT